MYVGLSSGFDSGAVYLAVLRQRRNHSIFLVAAEEDRQTVAERARWSEELSPKMRSELKKFRAWIDELSNYSSFSDESLTKCSDHVTMLRIFDIFD